MSRRPVASAALLFALAGSVCAETPGFAPLAHYAGPDGGWDYLSLDNASQRLYVARSYGVLAVDLAGGKVTEKLVEGQGVHGVLPLPGYNLVASANGKSDTVTLFDGASGAVVASIKTGANPDALAYEPKTQILLSFNGKGRDATLIDLGRREAAGAIALDGKPEFAVADGAGKIFVNLEDKAQIVAIDVKKREIVARHALPGCEAPTGLAFDKDSGLLISACDNGKTKAIEAATGKDVATVEICRGPDAALLDAARRRVLVPCADGRMSVISLEGEPKTVATVATATRAKTGAVDDKGRIYLGTAKFNPPAREGVKPQAIPGTFEVVVFGEAK